MSSSSIKECAATQGKEEATPTKTHDEKQAWAMESCLRDKNGLTVSNGRNVRIKECDKKSKSNSVLDNDKFGPHNKPLLGDEGGPVVISVP